MLDAGTCTWCGAKGWGVPTAQVAEISLDHYVPVIRKGDNSPWNLITACCYCNSLRRDLWAPHYLELLHREGRLLGTPDEARRRIARVRARRRACDGKRLALARTEARVLLEAPPPWLRYQRLLAARAYREDVVSWPRPGLPHHRPRRARTAADPTTWLPPSTTWRGQLPSAPCDQRVTDGPKQRSSARARTGAPSRADGRDGMLLFAALTSEVCMPPERPRVNPRGKAIVTPELRRVADRAARRRGERGQPMKPDEGLLAVVVVGAALAGLVALALALLTWWTP